MHHGTNNFFSQHRPEVTVQRPQQLADICESKAMILPYKHVHQQDRFVTF